MRLAHRRAIAVAALLLVYSAIGRAQPAQKIHDAPRGPDFGTTDRIQYHIGFTEFMTGSNPSQSPGFLSESRRQAWESASSRILIFRPALCWSALSSTIATAARWITSP